jgi:hypothetical protein
VLQPQQLKLQPVPMVHHHILILFVAKMEQRMNFVALDIILTQPAVNQQQQLKHQLVPMVHHHILILTVAKMELKMNFVAKMELLMNFAALDLT